MSYDELELDKLGDEKTALFFCISDTDSTLQLYRGAGLFADVQPLV